MRALGLDYGSAQCGCALSDPTGTIVTPIEPIARPGSRAGMAALLALVAERGVQRVVIGLPLSLSGGDTMQTRETRDFVRRFAHKLGESVPVVLHDERFTTRMAQQIPGAASSEHSRAAALLLEGWLAEWNRNGSAPSSR